MTNTVVERPNLEAMDPYTFFAYLGKRVIHSFVPEPHASGHPGGVGNDLHIGRP